MLNKPTGGIPLPLLIAQHFPFLSKTEFEKKKRIKKIEHTLIFIKKRDQFLSFSTFLY